MSMAIIPSQAALIAVVFPLVLGAISDIRSMRIGNSIVVALLAAYLAFAMTSEAPLRDELGSVGVALVVFLVGFLMFCRGWIGGGDVKFASVIILWVGSTHVIDFLLYASLLGGALTVMIVKLRAQPLPTPLSNIHWLANLHAHDRIPYGVALAGAAFLVLPHASFIAPLVATTAH